MAVSYHIVVLLFLFLAFVDVVLLSTRVLLSRQRHSLTTLYVLMAVEEAVVVFELLAILGQLLSTYLVTAGMWAHTASLFATFFPLWVLRAFFTAFTMVYKNVLIPRWTTAAAAAPQDVLSTASTRAWHFGGYGVVMVLDVSCCCLYYLSSVYVLGYLSDKTLYVPYHRRRWRHVQWERASIAAAAAKARDGGDGGAGAPESSPVSHAQRRKRGRGAAAEGSGGVHDPPAGVGCPFTTLARTASFAQWQRQHPQPATASPPPGSADTGGPCFDRNNSSGSAVPPTGEGTATAADPALRTRPSTSLQARMKHFSFPTLSPASVAQPGDDDGTDATAVFPRAVGACADSGQLHAFEDHSLHTALPGSSQPFPMAPAQRHGGGGGGGAGTSSVSFPPSKNPVHLFDNLTPLHLPRRFTLSSEGEEGHLNQFAAALVEHGFSTQSPVKKKGKGSSSPMPDLPPLHLGTNAESAATPSPAATSARSVFGDPASPRDGLADTASPDAAARGAAEDDEPPALTTRETTCAFVSATRGQTSPGRVPAPPPPQAESMTAAGPPLSRTDSRSSFRRIFSVLSATKGSKSPSAGNNSSKSSSNTSGSRSPASVPSSSQSESPFSWVPPAPSRQRSPSLVSFVLGSSGTGAAHGAASMSGRDGEAAAQQRAAGSASRIASPLALPPRPPASFRIDQTTGNVVAVPPKGP